MSDVTAQLHAKLNTVRSTRADHNMEITLGKGRVQAFLLFLSGLVHLGLTGVLTVQET